MERAVGVACAWIVLEHDLIDCSARENDKQKPVDF